MGLMGILDGKGALVTGGSRGIGRAIVTRLAADGATVVFSYLNNEKAAREVIAETGGKAFAVKADQGSMADLNRLFEETDRHLAAGGLDIVVCNAADGLPTAFTKVAALTFGGRGITANIVSPGATDTELLRSANPGDTFEETIAITSLKDSAARTTSPARSPCSQVPTPHG
jgi:NAD(P)-dependent dehydrogenase (short-subunit alcohol dehydrogenase family)